MAYNMNFWLFAPGKTHCFDAIAGILQASGLQYDSEKPWEWLQGDIRAWNAGVHISRQQENDMGLDNNRHRISITLPEDPGMAFVDAIAEKLRTGLQTTIFRGTVAARAWHPFEFSVLAVYPFP